MPAMPSFLGRKKKTKAEEPKYEALPPAAPAAPAAAAEPSPAAASAGAPSATTLEESEVTEPMVAVNGPTLLDAEKAEKLEKGEAKDVEIPKADRAAVVASREEDDSARSLKSENKKERGKSLPLNLLVPSVMLGVLFLLVVLFFVGVMPPAVQVQFDSLMGRRSACEAGVKGTCVSAAPTLHYYMYRVQNDEDYSPENQNMANIPGALWYLHNEIVWHHWLRAGTFASTPKTRIERFLVFSRASQELFDKGMNFGVVNTYDLGKCSGPYKCENLQQYGPVVGCESWNPKAKNNFPHGQWTGTNVYPNATWYSLPGKCSSNKFWKQQGNCVESEPSGACPLGVVPTGEWSCTYTYQKVGELRISDIEGIDSLEKLIEGGGREYDKESDKGVHVHFWDKIDDPKACQDRVDKVKAMFKKKYPDQPVLDDPPCDFNVGKFYPYFPAGTFDGHNATATKNNNANISNATRLLVTWGNKTETKQPSKGNSTII